MIDSVFSKFSSRMIFLSYKYCLGVSDFKIIPFEESDFEYLIYSYPFQRLTSLSFTKRLRFKYIVPYFFLDPYLLKELESNLIFLFKLYNAYDVSKYFYMGI